jgi:hypothetical protein
MVLYRRIRRPFAANEETTPLNWRRGLFRLWLLVSAAWVMSWSIYFILSAIAQALKTVGDFLAIPVVFFGPPIALLLCGMATRWAIRGFGAEKAPERENAPPPSEKVVPLQRGEGAEHGRDAGTGSNVG